ncbi:MAG: DUF72 domain-containing protein [Acidobacteria bacterium]|nr:DUF72 domain-containing protein [Acidobacteriota bacterium]
MVRVGTSGWHYPAGTGTWNGVFYPARRPRGFDELRYYAEHFDIVEVNSTFYRMPDAGHVARWVERTPADFLFAIKLFQKFTHPDMYLARAGVTDWSLSLGDVDTFRAGMGPLAEAGRLAALLVQFPSSFHAEAATGDYLAWLLQALAGYPLAVELRHRSWFAPGAGTHALLAAGAGRKVLAFMNNHFSAKAVANAAVLKSQLGQAVPGVYEREMVERYPDLRGLVTVPGLPI